jgi:hypothetical protein
MVVALDPIDLTRRLAYIRFLHGLGVEQADLPEPMSSAALLTFHDAVEMFLLAAGEHLGAPSIYEFEKYWTALSGLSGGVTLPVQSGMKRLNHLRKTLKHHGGQPARSAVDMAKADTATFLSASTRLVFGLDLDAVSMSSVIPQKSVRDLALQADAESASGDQVAAMIALVDAWEELFNSGPRAKAATGSSPLRFGPALSRRLSEQDIAAYLRNSEGSRSLPRLNEDIGRQIVDLTEVVTSLREAASLTAIGVDYAEYLRFRSLTPHRGGYMDGHREYRAHHAYAPTADHVADCMRFVVTAALRLAAAEAQLVEPPWIDPTKQGWQQPWETIKTIPRP